MGTYTPMSVACCLLSVVRCLSHVCSKGELTSCRFISTTRKRHIFARTPFFFWVAEVPVNCENGPGVGAQHKTCAHGRSGPHTLRLATHRLSAETHPIYRGWWCAVLVCAGAGGRWGRAEITFGGGHASHHVTEVNHQRPPVQYRSSPSNYRPSSARNPPQTGAITIEPRPPFG